MPDASPPPPSPRLFISGIVILVEMKISIQMISNRVCSDEYQGRRTSLNIQQSGPIETEEFIHYSFTYKQNIDNSLYCKRIGQKEVCHD